MAKDKVLYINLTVQNGAEAVKHKVTKKLEKSKLVPTSLARGAAQIAASDYFGASIGSIAQKMSRELCRKIPKKLIDKGLTVEMKEVYRKGPYVVLQLRIVKVDASAFTGSDDNWFLWWMLDFIQAGNQQHFEEDYLPKVVTKWLAQSMPELLEEGIALEKIEAETHVLKEKEQARYFFDKLTKIRDEKDEAKKAILVVGGGKSSSPPSKIKQFRRQLSRGISFNSDAGSSVSEAFAIQSR